MSPNLWSTLGVAPTNDLAEIKRAYARRLKEVHPEDDPEGFQALRAAYDRASQLARNGWAVPPARDASADDAQEDDDDADAWVEPAGRAWQAPVGGNAAGWTRGDADRWTAPDVQVEAPPDDALPDDVRAELARERQLAEAHNALCDALRAVISNPDGDKHEALSAMLRILRSPGMDSLDAYARTERWLAHVVASGGPVVDDMVEPLIQFFRWHEQPVGLDMSHAAPVLRRRDAGIALRRLERKMDPNHAAWVALRDKPTRFSRLRAALSPGLQKRVLAMLAQIDEELPEFARKMDPEAVAWWRERRRRPGLDAVFLWILLLAPPFVGLCGAASTAFGPPSWATFFALWTVTTTALLGGGMAWLHGAARPRQRWIEEGLAWRAPPWIRYGWAPAMAGCVIIASLSPLNLPWVAGYWLVMGPIVVWTRIVTAHLAPPVDRRGALLAAAPLLAWLVVHAHGGQFVGLCWTAAAAVLVTNRGGPALQEAWLSLPELLRRRIAVGGLAVAALSAAALVLAPDWPYRAPAAALVVILALAARPIRLLQPPQVVSLWLVWIRFGWLVSYAAVAFLPDQDMATATFRGVGLWLAVGAGLTAAYEAWPRLFHVQRRRKPGALA